MGTLQSPVSGVRLLVVLCLPLLACKLGKSDEDPDSRPLPDVPSAAPATPQPAQAAAPTPAKAAEPPATASAPTPAPIAEQAAKAAAPNTATKNAGTTAATSKPDTKETAEANTTGSKDSTTGSTTTGGKINPRSIPVPISDPAAACFSKCAKALNKCLQDVKLGDDVAKKCRGAFESCQKNCKQ